MANAPIIYPTVYKPKAPNTSVSQLDALGDGSNAFIKGQFVVNDSDLWEAVAAAPLKVGGLVLDDSHAATDEPFNALYGENHNPVNPRTCTFLMNVTDAAGAEGSGSTTHTDVTLGHYYTVRYGATSSTKLMINAASGAAVPASTGGVFWKVVGLFNAATTGNGTGDAAADKNGRVIVEIDPIGLQYL